MTSRKVVFVVALAAGGIVAGFGQVASQAGDTRAANCDSQMCFISDGKCDASLNQYNCVESEVFKSGCNDWACSVE